MRSEGSRSITSRSMASITSASHSSSSRTAVTFGEGMVLSTCVSMISKLTFRTWLARLSLALVPSGA